MNNPFDAGRGWAARYAIALSALVALQALAAEGLPLRPEGAEQRIVVGLAFDPTFMTSISYAYPLKRISAGQVLELSASAAVPIFLLDGKHLRADAGARMEFAGPGPLVLAGELAVAFQSSSNFAYSAAGVGLDFGGLLAYRGGLFFADVELSYRKNLANDIRFSDEYRSRVMASAKDGWYGSMGGTLSAALGCGVRIFRSMHAAAKIGVALTEGLAVPVPFVPLPPLTLALSLGYCLPR